MISGYSFFKNPPYLVGDLFPSKKLTTLSYPLLGVTPLLGVHGVTEALNISFSLSDAKGKRPPGVWDPVGLR